MAKKIYLVEVKDDEYKTFDNWPACQAFVKGKDMAYGSGFSREEALDKVARSRAYLEKGGKKKPKPVGDKPTTGICSDAGTRGNPGPCEYQVCSLDGTRLAYEHLGVHSNNYAELAGIEGMIRYAVEHDEVELWTDSQIAMGWLRKDPSESVRERDAVMEIILRIRQLLAEHKTLQLKKWHTKQWGEIPADFGRK